MKSTKNQKVTAALLAATALGGVAHAAPSLNMSDLVGTKSTAESKTTTPAAATTSAAAAAQQTTAPSATQPMAASAQSEMQQGQSSTPTASQANASRNTIDVTAIAQPVATVQKPQYTVDKNTHTVMEPTLAMHSLMNVQRQTEQSVVEKQVDGKPELQKTQIQRAPVVQQEPSTAPLPIARTTTTKSVVAKQKLTIRDIQRAERERLEKEALEQAALEAQQQQLEEQKRAAKVAEAQRQAALKAEQDRIAAQQAEHSRIAEEQRVAAEQERLRIQEEQRRMAEQKYISAQQAEAQRQAALKAQQEQLTAQQAEAQRQAAIKAEQEHIAAQQAEAQQQAALKAQQEQLAAQQAEAQRQAAIKAEQERIAAQQAEQERLAAQQRAAAAEKAKAEREAALKAQQEQLAAQQAEAQRQAALKAEQERIAAQQAEAQRQAALKAQQEQLAAQQAEAQRQAALKAEQERIAAQQAEQERLAAQQRAAAAEKAKTEREAAIKAEQERIAAYQAEAQRQAALKAEQERIAAQQAEAQRQAALKAEQERIAAQQAEAQRQAALKAEQERIAAQQAEAQRQATLKAEQERIAAEKTKTEQERLAAEEAEKAKAAAAEKTKTEEAEKAKAAAAEKAKTEEAQKAKTAENAKAEDTQKAKVEEPKTAENNTLPQSYVESRSKASTKGSAITDEKNILSQPMDPPLQADTSAKINLTFDAKNYETMTGTVDNKTITYRAFEYIPYVSNPIDIDQQYLNIYVPEEYFNNGTINGYTTQTAPIFMPNSVGGYMPSQPMVPKAENGKPNSALYALSRGYVVASPATRGRTNKASDGNYIGKAPAVIVDLQAATAYLHANDAAMPGNANRIITNGTSAGGAVSLLQGAAGNNVDFQPYLQALGAATAPTDVYASSAYAPITNLDAADMAYEWSYNGITSFDKVSMGQGELPQANVSGNNAAPPKRTTQRVTLNTDDVAYSNLLKEHFPDYVNNLQLRDSIGRVLRLDKNGDGSFKAYVKAFIIDAINKAQANGTDVSKHTYVIRDPKTGAIKDINWEAYNRFVSRSKAPGAFDSRSNDSGENNLFGTSTSDNNHFTITAALHDTTSNQDVYVENAKIVTMMNPMNYLGSPAATNARYYRIRYGTADSNTSMAIPLIVGTRAQNLGYRVDMATPFNVDHSGDYDLEELFNWMDSIVKNSR